MSLPIRSGALIRKASIPNLLKLYGRFCHHATVASSYHSPRVPAEQRKQFSHIGEREVVGYGRNGIPQYLDDCMHPYPSIRFREDSTTFEALLKKEKGNWKQLSLEEKKALYRASFCSTFQEMLAPNPEWKLSFSFVFGLLGFSSLFYLFLRKFFYPPLPPSVTSHEHRQETLYQQIINNNDPVLGVASKFDYENMRWKE